MGTAVIFIPQHKAESALAPLLIDPLLEDRVAVGVMSLTPNP